MNETSSFDDSIDFSGFQCLPKMNPSKRIIDLMNRLEIRAEKAFCRTLELGDVALNAFRLDAPQVAGTQVDKSPSSHDIASDVEAQFDINKGLRHIGRNILFSGIGAIVTVVDTVDSTINAQRDPEVTKT